MRYAVRVITIARLQQQLLGITASYSSQIRTLDRTVYDIPSRRGPAYIGVADRRRTWRPPRWTFSCKSTHSKHQKVPSFPQSLLKFHCPKARIHSWKREQTKQMIHSFFRYTYLTTLGRWSKEWDSSVLAYPLSRNTTPQKRYKWQQIPERIHQNVVYVGPLARTQGTGAACMFCYFIH